MCRSRYLPLAVALLGAFLYPGPLLAQVGPPAQTLPLDRAFVELDVPPGTKVTVSGKDRGTRMQILYGGIPKDGRLCIPVEAVFANGTKARTELLLQGGWHVRLPLRPPGSGRLELVPQTGHIDQIQALVFSADGRRVLTGGDSNAILWDAQSGMKLRAFSHPQEITSVALSADGNRILTGSSSGTAILWDAQSGRKLHTFQRHTGSVRAALSADGRRALTGSSDGTAMLWDAQSGEHLRTFKGGIGKVGFVALSADGRRGLTAGDRASILWNVETGASIRTFPGSPSPTGLTGDGRRVLTLGDKGAILWDAESGQQLWIFPGRQGSLVASASGLRVLTVTPDKTAVLWDAQSGQRLQNFSGHSDLVTAAALSRDGQRVLTGTRDRSVVLWDAPSGQKIQTFGGHTDRVIAVALSADSRYILVGSDHETATLWDAQRSRQIQSFTGHTDEFTSVALNGDGRRALTGSRDKTAILWDAQSGQQLRTFRRHTASVAAVAISSDGERILTGSADKTAVVWDAASGQALKVFSHPAPVTSVALSADGRRALTAARNNTATLWDVQSGKVLREFTGPTTSVRDPSIAVAFSARGHRVLVGLLTGREALVWNGDTGKRHKTFNVKTDTFSALTLNSDGRRVAAGLTDGTVLVWDAQESEEHHVFAGHTDEVSSIAYSSDGRRLLTGSWDGTARLWDVATSQELCRFISIEDGKEWLVTTPEGFFDGSSGARQHVSFRVGGGLDVVPVDRFFQDFYRPGLLAALQRGERPMPNVEFAAKQPPLVRIASPTPGSQVEKPEVTITVDVEDKGGGVKGVRLSHNGARVLESTRQDPEGKVTRVTFTLKLVEGNNKFEAQAASGDGSWESEPARLTLRYQTPLPKAEVYVLAVGVNKYADAGLDLRFAAEDAKALAGLFQRRGPALYQKVHLHTLLDNRATRANISAALKTIAQTARAQDALIVLLAGHGTTVDQRYYFLPHEFKRTPGQSLEDDLSSHGLSGEKLGEELAAVPALKRVLIFDTCHSGGAILLAKLGGNPFAFHGAIERLSRAQGMFALAASAVDDEAKEVPELGHGVLTYTLLAGLKAVTKGPLRDEALLPGSKDRVATVLEWFAYASGQVPPLTRRYFKREQNVQTSGQGQNFPILPLEGR